MVHRGRGVAAAVFAWTRPTRRGHASRFVLMLPDSARLLQVLGGVRIALAPDGTQLAYVGVSSHGVGGAVSIIYMRALDDTVSRFVRGTERD